MPAKNPTACLLVIGNEVLSGRTQDANIRFLARGLGDLRDAERTAARIKAGVAGDGNGHSQPSAPWRRADVVESPTGVGTRV